MGETKGPFPWIVLLAVLAILVVVACGTLWAVNAL